MLFGKALNLFLVSNLLSLAYGALDVSLRGKPQCWGSGNKQPSKFWKEGSRVDRGKYWYVCHNGEFQPRGCFAPKNKRISIGESYVEGGYEMTCVMGSSGFVTFDYSGCVPDGNKRYKVGETWTDTLNRYWFACKTDGPYLRIDVGGCVAHDHKTHLAIGEEYDHQGFTYQCMKKASGVLQMCTVGCFINGNRKKIGEQWNDTKYIYVCKGKGGRAAKSPIGCIHNGKNLYDGDSFERDDQVYQCQIRESHFGLKSTGCLAQDSNGKSVHKVHGCRWTLKKNDNVKIDQSCEEVKGKSVVRTHSCVLTEGGYDVLYLQPNTYTIWSSENSKSPKGYACIVKKDGDAELKTHSIKDLPSKVHGLKYDKPRG
uniref:Ricin B-type lectin domain-containing protein n=1 Tax=Rhabditophanes sp. KR3021 TaxID=114890 RepID=A0AC35TYT2_9BILA